VSGAVGMLFHRGVDRAHPELDAARRMLEKAGLRGWEVPREASPRELADRLRSTQLIITLGGDGTLLYGARLAAPSGIPLLGVNLGRLGFLTELELDGLSRGLDRFRDGAFSLEERTLIQVTVKRGTRTLRQSLGLNEAALQRGKDGTMARLRFAVDGQEVGTLDSDGAIVATASGSTAYALAAGGPILEPTVQDLLLVPINPFALTVRPIVFPPRQALTITLVRGSGLISVDGGPARTLMEDDVVWVAAYGKRLGMVRFGPPGRFYEVLRQKLGWGHPLVPTP
jgi:NAD+ kinase